MRFCLGLWGAGAGSFPKLLASIGEDLAFLKRKVVRAIAPQGNFVIKMKPDKLGKVFQQQGSPLQQETTGSEI